MVRHDPLLEPDITDCCIKVKQFFNDGIFLWLKPHLRIIVIIDCMVNLGDYFR